MKRYRLIKRGLRGGTFCAFDKETKKRESLKTKSLEDAQQIINARNDALRQPHINLAIAKAFLFGADYRICKRTWSDVFDSVIDAKHGVTQLRWKTARKDKAFASLMQKRLIETTADHFLEVLKANKVPTTIP